MYLGVFTHSIAIILKYEKEKKRSKEKSACPHTVIVAYADMQFSNFVIEYLRATGFSSVRAQVPLRCCVILKENSIHSSEEISLNGLELLLILFIYIYNYIGSN